MTEKRKANHRQKILRYLRTHRKGISNRDMTVSLGIGSPTKRISELRAKGFPIVSDWIVKTDEEGNSYRYKMYKLEERRSA